MSPFYRVIRWLLIVVGHVIFRYRTHGQENIPSTGGVVLCSNHTSMMDVVFLISTCKRQIHFMAKAELFRIPILKHAFRWMGAFPVERGTGGADALAKAQALVQEGKVMGIFPEGTRSKTGTPGKAKSGAAVVVAKTGAPVVPVSIYRKAGKMRLFAKATVRYGQPIPAKTLALDDAADRSRLRAVSQAIMAQIVAQWELGF